MFLLHTFALFGIVLARYFVFAGLGWLVFWRWKREAWAPRKIRAEVPPKTIRHAEIAWSVSSSAVFALAGSALYLLWARGWTRLYFEPARWGMGYLLLSLPLWMFLHDTYFYWAHRLMHHPRLFATFHRVHHLSRNPTPWAAFSFHPWEAVVEALIFPLLACLVPIHIGVFFVFLMVMTALSVVNHLGYELYPRDFATHPVGKWIISASHHDVHHRRGKGNYGLYFRTWDRWAGTDHAHDQATCCSSTTS